MGRLNRILRVVVLAVLASGQAPAFANHGTGPQGLDPAGGHHEDMPELAVATPADACVFTGQILPGTAFVGSAHPIPVPSVNDDAEHSHSQLVNSLVNCTQTGPLDVVADFGNDGHMVELWATPTCLFTVRCVELDPVTGGGPVHPFNSHHGSVGESAWSNSSGFSGGEGGGESNGCTGTANQNKGDIDIRRQASGAQASGWLKYVRVAAVVHMWGCFTGGTAAGPNNHFSITAALVPDLVPVSIPPFFPGTGDPTCILEFARVGPACGFLVVGVGVMGPSWLP